MVSQGQVSAPLKSSLHQGVILGTIAHAIWVMHYPDFSHEQSWDGCNYSVQDSMGSRGTITFSGNKVVGVFFDETSSRNPFRSKETYNPEPFFAGMPADLFLLAKEEALQYMLQEYQGSVVPIVTTIFWNDGETLTSTESWKKVFINGARLIRIQLLPIEEAIGEWQNAYQITNEQVRLMRLLFEKKLASPEESIVLTDAEKNVLTGNVSEGLKDSRELLAAIGIIGL